MSFSACFNYQADVVREYLDRSLSTGGRATLFRQGTCPPWYLPPAATGQPAAEAAEAALDAQRDAFVPYGWHRPTQGCPRK